MLIYIYPKCDIGKYQFQTNCYLGRSPNHAHPIASLDNMPLLQ